jgi:signal transduction histidine kinase
MATPLRVLIVEDRPADAQLMIHELRRVGFEPEWQVVATEEKYREQLRQQPDLVLSDYFLPNFDGQRALEIWQEYGQDIPFIIVSGPIGEETAADCLNQGAADYVRKDRLTRLGYAAVRALERKQLRLEAQQAMAQLRQANEQLEERVVERTAELAHSRERLRRLNQRTVFFQEDERRRVSHELHDSAGQLLTVLQIKLALLRDDLPADPALTQAQLSEAIQAIKSVTEEIRLLAQALRPPALEHLGLNAILDGLCREVAQRSGIDIRYQGANSLPRLPETVAITFYRFLQEALNNLVAHSGATAVNSTLAAQNGVVNLLVADNGRGFDVARLMGGADDGRNGLGLLGMRERFELLGGSLQIESRPGEGTRLVASCPVKD